MTVKVDVDGWFDMGNSAREPSELVKHEFGAARFCCERTKRALQSLVELDALCVDDEDPSLIDGSSNSDDDQVEDGGCYESTEQ